jgi:hypothetical protein
MRQPTHLGFQKLEASFCPLNLINPKPLNPGQLGKTNSPFFEPLSVGNRTSAVYQKVIFTFFFTPLLSSSSSIVLLAFETLPNSKHCLNCVLLIKTCLLSHPELRAQFIMESVADLRKNLQQRGLDLIVRRGKPEDVMPSIAKAIGAHTVCLLIFQY